MAAELGLLSLTQLQSFLVQSQQQPQLINHSATSAGCPWMWNPKQAATAAVQDQDEDSWEERAFEEDSSNVTWPPRSYTCTFCRREFRSAQALGGHMNVHRRDRARLHQTLLPGSSNPAAMVGTSSGPSTLLIQTQDFVGNGGLCFLYSIPNPSGAFTPTAMNTCINSPPNLSPVTQNSVDNLISTNPPSNNFLVNPLSVNSLVNHIGNLEPSTSFTNDNCHGNTRNMNNSSTEELDLELRLGRGRSSPT